MQINPTQSVLGTTYTSKTFRTEESSRAASTPAGEQVSISTAGRQIASAENKVPGSQAGGNYPLEMYQIPQWMADYSFELPNQLGARGDWFSQKYPQAWAASEEDRAEYSIRLQQHYQGVLADNGIQSLEEHYQATILDKSSSESLRQQMSARLMGDSRMMELLALMGKTVS